MQHRGHLTESFPRFLEVEAFAAAREQEIRALGDSLKALDGGKKFGIGANPRQLRRRTGAYNTFKHNLRPNFKKFAKRRRLNKQSSAPYADQDEPQEGENEDATKLESRAMRRRRGRLQASMEASAASSTVGQGLRRLESHVWHAKRMHMKSRWGHMLAEGQVGKGHGSRGLLHKLQQGTIMHDASYWCPLQLSGQTNSLLNVIASISDPVAVQSLRLDEAFLAGSKEHRGMLHHPNSFPTKAISPMAMLLSPPEATSGEELNQTGQEGRELLVFVHAAAAMEGEAALRAASRRQGVGLKDRQAELRLIELKGMGADAAVAAALTLSTPEQNTDSVAEQIWRDMAKTDQARQGFDKLPDGTVLSIRARDPRLARRTIAARQRELHTEQNGYNALSASAQDCSSSEGTRAAMLQSLVDSQTASISSIWTPDSVPSALSEKQVSSLLRQARNDALHLSYPSRPEYESTAAQEGPLCPIMAIRCSGRPSNPTSWSLVVPKGWVCPIWGALAFTGATPAGQREWRWVADQCGAGFFPHDFPDTRAAAEMAATLAAEDEALRRLRPKGRYPDAIAIDWTILSTSGEDARPSGRTVGAAAGQSTEAQGVAQPGPEPIEPADGHVMDINGQMSNFSALPLPRDDLRPAFLKLPQHSPLPAIEREVQDSRGVLSSLHASETDRLGQSSEPAQSEHARPHQPAAHSRGVPGAMISARETSPPAQVCLALEVHPVSGACSVGLLLRSPDSLDLPVGTAILPSFLRPKLPQATGLLGEGCYIARSLDTLRAAMTGLSLGAASTPQKAPRLLWQPKRAHNTAAAPHWTADSKCMVRVRLQISGRGTAEDGAAVLAPSQPGTGPAEEQVIGYCTSGAPRGLSAKRGASAVCSARCLWRLAAARPGQPPKNGKLGPVRVLVKNPRSPVSHAATALLWVELSEGDSVF